VKKPALAILSATLAATALPGLALASQTKSFVIGSIYMPAMDIDDKSCPTTSKSALEIFRDTLPAAERAKYMDHSTYRELGKLMYDHLGFRRSEGDTPITPANIDDVRRKFNIPAGKGAFASYPTRHLAYDSCTNPDDFPTLAVGTQEYRGKVAYGMNLDGKVKKGDFTGVDGEAGVDNAWYRAMGCSLTTRTFGDPKVSDKILVSQAAPTLIEVTGIDNDRNDDAVVVNIYASADALELNATGGALAWASFHPDPRPAFTASVKGRIVDGVLTTDIFDVNMRMHEQIIDSRHEMRGTRLRATFAPNGTIEGGFYGYHTLASLEDAYAQSSTIGSDLMSCPAAIGTLRKHADGFPDPHTHRNTAISSMLRFKAVPAFVIHEQTPAKVASK
jgi:hypothetical protein